MDLIYVTYNSEKWLEKCFFSLNHSEFDKKRLNIYVVDNNSTDNTVKKLHQYQKELGNNFGCFKIIENKENLGFGKANNIGFQLGNSEIVCFLNIDTEVFPETLINLEQEIRNAEDNVGVWELRQFPYEHPKFYNPLDGETTWVSGAAFAVRRKVFQEVKGFDEKIFMYAEDVDLSWRIRSIGYKLKYCPKVTIIHHSYENANEVKPNQFYNSIINNLLLRYRYSGIKTILRGHLQFWNIVRHGGPFYHSRIRLVQYYLKHFTKMFYFLSSRVPRNFGFYPKFLGMDYEFIRRGAFYKNEYPGENPQVSIIVRTCGRPAVLRETLESLRKQTYTNIEIVVVEDGENISEKMIQEEFSDLNVKYYATKEKVGRSKAGNTAMEMASGKYLNFLDDDDLFFADHVEVLVKNLEKSKNKAAFAVAFETPIQVKSKEPYVYEVMEYNEIHKQEFNRFILCHHNYIPIQCIMFEKSLFEAYGGLDESLDALEDWDLWVRYSLYTDFGFVDKTTSIYRVPFNKKINKERQKSLDDALIVLREKHKEYYTKMSVYDIAVLYEKGVFGKYV